jgi:hypothetical protein
MIGHMIPGHDAINADRDGHGGIRWETQLLQSGRIDHSLAEPFIWTSSRASPAAASSAEQVCRYELKMSSALCSFSPVGIFLSLRGRSAVHEVDEASDQQKGSSN